MKMLVRSLVVVGSLMPAAFASDLTDAMLDTDPRIELRSGTGAAYGSVYSPEETAPTSSQELDATQVPSLRGAYRYDRSFEGFRSPLYEPEPGTTASRPPPDDPYSTTVTPVPLGKPYEREGVWYQDDLTP
ncbi:MAG: hypothetical protein HYY91_00050 [Candidatus Omnitrophica bacterium]|nr:hypothetical protein [Candidatus Omnitrophota bacterium]